MTTTMPCALVVVAARTTARDARERTGVGLTRDTRGWDGDSGERGHDDLVCGAKCAGLPLGFSSSWAPRSSKTRRVKDLPLALQVVVATSAEDVAPRGRGGVAALRIAGGEAKVRQEPEHPRGHAPPGPRWGARAGQI